MKKLKIKNSIFIITSILIILITYIYMKNTKTIYFWDNVGYWGSSMGIVDLLKISPKECIKDIISSILFLDYTNLPACIPAICMSIISKSRITYTISITIFYVLPSIYLLLDICNKLLKKNKNVKLKIFLNIFTVLTATPLILSLSFDGYVDIGGLIILLLIIKIYLFKLEPKEGKKYIFKLITIGILLMTSFFFRRWYVYWILSFLGACFIYDLLNIIKIGKKDKEKLKLAIIECLKKYIIIGLTMLGVVLITIILYYLKFRNNSIENFYLYKLLFYDYSYAYSAYQKGFMHELLNFLNHIGLINIIIAMITFVYLKLRKDENKNKVVNILFLQMIICFILFEKAQSHEVHHLLLYLPALTIINTIGIKELIENRKKISNIIITIFLINIILLFPCFNNSKIITKAKNCGLLMDFNFKPVIREDIEELEEVKEYIESLCENTTNKVYLNSSSIILNSSIISNFNRSMNISYTYMPNLLGISEVDKRDGVPLQILSADIVIVTSPDQIHLSPDDQKMVSYINKIFINKEGICNNFELINTMKLDDIDIYFYKKNKEFTGEEKEKFHIDAKNVIND